MQNSKALILLLSLFSFSILGGQEKKKPKRVSPMSPIEEVAGLPNVLIIGDSISIGYTLPTRALLKGTVSYTHLTLPTIPLV